MSRLFLPFFYRSNSKNQQLRSKRHEQGKLKIAQDKGREGKKKKKCVEERKKKVFSRRRRHHHRHLCQLFQFGQIFLRQKVPSSAHLNTSIFPRRLSKYKGNCNGGDEKPRANERRGKSSDGEALFALVALVTPSDMTFLSLSPSPTSPLFLRTREARASKCSARERKNQRGPSLTSLLKVERETRKHAVLREEEKKRHEKGKKKQMLIERERKKKQDEKK